MYYIISKLKNVSKKQFNTITEYADQYDEALDKLQKQRETHDIYYSCVKDSKGNVKVEYKLKQVN